MILEKIKKLFSYYLNKQNSTEELIEFQKQFEVIFDFFRDELIDEVGMNKYEILDTIYNVFDAYEPNEKIRETESYCIDEIVLINRIKEIYQKLITDRT